MSKETSERVRLAQEANPEDCGTGLCTMREAVNMMLENKCQLSEFTWIENGKRINIEIIITRAVDV